MLLLTNGINGLGPQDLKPSELKFAKNDASYYARYFAILRKGFISVIGYRICVFGKGKKKHNELVVKEVHRWLPKTDEHYCCDHFGHCAMNDGFYFWGSDREWRNGTRYYVDKGKSPNSMLRKKKRVSGKWHSSEDWNPLFSEEEYAEWIKENIYPYYDFDRKEHIGITAWYAWDFLHQYMHYLPASEYFVKLGYPGLVRNPAFCLYKNKTLQRFCKWLAKSGKEIRSERKYTVQYGAEQVRAMFKLNITAEEYEKREALKHIKTILNISADDKAKEIYKYLAKQYKYAPIPSTWYIEHYKDYLEQAKSMGLDITSRGVLFPSDFSQRIVELAALKKAKENLAKIRALRNAHKKLGIDKTVTYKDGLSFVIPTTQKQFVEIGNKLHMCVGSCGYSDKVVQGTSLIIGVWKDNKPVNCVELGVPTSADDKYKTLQNRGDHNRDSEFQDLVSKDLAKYIAMANQSWRNIHATA